MKITHTEDYSRMRQLNYPSIEDFIDAMYWQQNGDSSKLSDYYAKITLVKAKYPKPAKAK